MHKHVVDQLGAQRKVSAWLTRFARSELHFYGFEVYKVYTRKTYKAHISKTGDIHQAFTTLGIVDRLKKQRDDIYSFSS